MEDYVCKDNTDPQMGPLTGKPGWHSTLFNRDWSIMELLEDVAVTNPQFVQVILASTPGQEEHKENCTVHVSRGAEMDIYVAESW